MLVGWLVGWLAGWLFGWMVTWFVCDHLLLGDFGPYRIIFIIDVFS
jgi:hypothetical protein